MQKIGKISAISIKILVALIIFFTVMTGLCEASRHSTLEKMVEYGYATVNPYVALIVSAFTFYSTVRYAVLFDSFMREKYMQQHSDIESVADKLKLFFGMKYTIVAAVLFAVILFALPVGSWCALVPLFFGEGTADLIFKLAASSTALALMALLGTKAVCSAIKFWEEDQFYSQKNGFKYTLKNYITKHITLYFAYAVGGAFALMIANYAGNNIGYFISENFSKLFGLFTLFFHLFFIFPKVAKRVISALKRKKFLEELERVCAEHHCSLSPVKHPYRSLFKNIEGEYNFEFERGGVQYACKLLCAKHRLRPITFYGDGMAAVSKIVNIKKVELFRVNKYFNYGFEAEGKKKLIVINPIPKTLFVNGKSGDKLIDNGDSAWGYKIYSATALINAIDRGCLDK